ncbi:YusW family protein [Geomicrobium sediminis]|uniref:YusW-like protein n=1 Tax=Geomicrobium sediminis TaxID=1347788 RepID=A0ABS2P9T7_9BACL|nr:YusW family protein [Geomicrobium sediminis]MBM7632164.1 hypothetical protein [Geomicrobium sediminis]
MKKFGMAALTAVFATGLVACGDTTDDEGQDTVEVPAEDEMDDDLDTDEDDTDMDDDTTEDTDSQEAAAEDWFEELNFEQFQLDAEYGEQTFMVDYDYNDGEPQAVIEDNRDDEAGEIQGEDALDELATILPEMNIDDQATEEELIEEAIMAFELDEDYDEIEVEVEFFNDADIDADDEDEDEDENNL